MTAVLRGPGDALGRRPARILVAGTSGAGKTTVAAHLSRLLDLPHVEMDGLFHGPGWTPRASFVTDVEAFSRGPRWVAEWQYTAVREMLAERADLLVWLDHPRALIMRQVIVRTLRRRLRRERLWNGNLEPPLPTILTDPEHIVRWAWTSHARTAERVLDLRRRHPAMTVVRLRGRAEVRHWFVAVVGPVARGDGDAVGP